jgi:hypothetical protein
VQGIRRRPRPPRRDAGPVVGSAVGPIALEPVGGIVVTALVDNVYDALLTSDDTITRGPLAAGTAQTPQFEPGLPPSG